MFNIASGKSGEHAVIDSNAEATEESTTEVDIGGIDTEFTDEDNAFEAVDTEVQKETSDDGFVRGTKPSDDELLKEFQEYLKEGLLTQEEYDAAVKDIGSESSIYDSIPSNPGPQQANDCGDCGTCISDCGAPCVTASGNYCNIQ